MNAEHEQPEIQVCTECGHEYRPGLSGDLSAGCPKCLVRFLGDEDSPAPRGGGGDHLKPGNRIDGMEILEVIGWGGMGVVYKARQDKLDRIVALKVLDARLAENEEFTQRFRREAKALAALNHPNIVHVYDYGQDGDRFYLVMEYVDGATLRHILTTGRVSPETALRYVPQICDALEYAHGRGVIHRDIKPENLLIDPAGNLKIADFGLAKMAARPGTESLMVTAVDRVMGTPSYMAPEQMRTSGAVDHRADIYSLGVVFYEMLTGELPLGRFPMPSQRVRVDVHLDEVVIKALEQDPNLRYQHASQIKQDVSGESPAGSVPRRRSPEPAGRGGSTDFRHLAWFAALCLPWGLPILWEICRNWSEVTAARPTTFHQSEIYRFFLMPFGILATVTATVLGWRALCRSKDDPRGRWLAWTTALAYPLLVLLLLGYHLPLVLKVAHAATPHAGIVVLGLVLIPLVAIGLRKPKPKALVASAVACTTFLLLGGGLLIRSSAEMRDAYTDYRSVWQVFANTSHALEHGLPTTSMQREENDQLVDDLQGRLARLEDNRFGIGYLERLDRQFELFFFGTPEETATGERTQGTLMTWIDPNRQGITFLRRQDRSRSRAGLSGPLLFEVLDGSVEGDACVVGYRFVSPYDPEKSDNGSSERARQEKAQFEQIRNSWKKEPNRPYEVRIPIGKVFEGGDQGEWWKDGEPRN